ncbi:hypothetical protein K7T73_09700 [Bacillus badius]|uniref:hypothetical protein n=2 Tax=Bacillus badius TaxID=1455 RepID=UPI001CBC2A8E|nr:hypothetical protein [Bacillus badius]UAT32453.1 hypothetical protein K7T73_09700 [Bacillus badius]GLY12708.1 hypothetical protein Bbad01_39240 [Bacillus badius]
MFKNMNKEKAVKLIGVVFAFGFVIVLFNMFFGADEAKDESSSVSVEEVADTDKKEGAAHNKERSFDDEVEVNVVDDENEEQAIPGETEPDFEKEYTKQYGKEAVEAAQGAAGRVTALYLLDEVNPEEWKPYATKEFYDRTIQSIEKSMDDKKRDIHSIEVVPTEPQQENQIRFVVFAKWDLYETSGKTVNSQNKMYYVNVIPKDGKWYVDEIEGLEDVFNK